MGFVNALKDFLKPDDEYLDEETNGGELFPPLRKKNAETAQVPSDEKVVNIMAATQHRVIILSPNSFKDSYDCIADHLRNRHILVINLERTNKDDARNLLYFIGGVVNALDGQLQIIATNTYMATPTCVQLEGVVEDLLGQLENVYIG
ncbi:MAG: cell division protein SepF [Oscillospiraceae bacterium]|nr:cell division protein SepF [Oscillospiraceae bacterium]